MSTKRNFLNTQEARCTNQPFQNFSITINLFIVFCDCNTFLIIQQHINPGLTKCIVS